MTTILLHALARTRWSMRRLARHLEREGHSVVAIDYPSTRARLPELAAFVADELRRRGIRFDESTSFVGHSMGGLVYRALAGVFPGERCGPSVTLGSPLEGSTVAANLSRLALARRFYGPAFAELGRARTLPFPGPTLAIAGTRASPLVPAYWILRATGERRPSDSTVLVDEALARAAVAHAEVEAAHTFLPSHPEAMRLVARFLADPASFQPHRARPLVGLFVGGASSRMGSPKGRLLGPDGRPLLERLIAVASRVGEVVLVGDASPYADVAPGLRRLADRPAGIGPIGGLAALLHAAGERDAVALACDLPYADGATLDALVARRSDRSIVALRADPNAPFEPLFARYAPAARDRVDRAIAEGRHSIQAVLREADADWFTPDRLDAIRDWDTPADVAADRDRGPPSR